MSDKNMEMMKEFLAKKKEKQKQSQNFSTSNKVMPGQTGKKKLKARGSNNKV
ncbi:MAG: hypothetical protein JW702_05085 [Clostridiales bacterium]|nr:hypothetical protein [Clostridiales bacterium]